MKKSLIFSLVFALLLVPSVSAYFGDMEFLVRDLIETGRGIVAPILEVLVGDYSTSEFFFAKVLLMVLVFLFAQFALKRIESIKDQKAVVNIVASVVAILSIRYIQDNELFNFILLPYGVFGIAITAIIPFLLYFYFVHNGFASPAGRRLAWIFFGIVFCALWWSRSNEIGVLGNQIYGWTLFAVVLALIFDKNLHSYFSLHDLNLFKREATVREILRLRKEYRDLQGDYSHHAEEAKAKIVKRLEKLEAEA